MDTQEFRDTLVGLLISEAFEMTNARDDVISCIGKSRRGCRLAVIIMVKEGLIIVITTKTSSRERVDSNAKIEKALSQDLLFEVMDIICCQ